MKNITFNSKETYLAYRSAWKAEYKNLSAEIRLLRLADRFYQRNQLARLPLTDAEHLCLARARQLCGSEPFTLHLANFQRRARSARATAMLAELKEAKAEAQRQYLARRAPEAGLPPGRG
jgi:hypothetical protein